jgi:hypothetical protein
VLDLVLLVGRRRLGQNATVARTGGLRVPSRL